MSGAFLTGFLGAALLDHLVAFVREYTTFRGADSS